MRVADQVIGPAGPGAGGSPAGAEPRRVRPIPLLWILMGVLLAVLACDDANAQSTRTEARVESEELNLVFEREVYLYVGGGRRDPFLPLTGDLGVNPRFDSVRLTGIIQSPNPRESVVVLTDRNGRVYRARPGEVVGDARVVDISSNRVVFAVSSFGVVRQETLELTPPGAPRALAAATQDEFPEDEPSPAEEPVEAANAAGANP